MASIWENFVAALLALVGLGGGGSTTSDFWTVELPAFLGVLLGLLL